MNSFLNNSVYDLSISNSSITGSSNWTVKISAVSEINKTNKFSEYEINNTNYEVPDFVNTYASENNIKLFRSWYGFNQQEGTIIVGYSNGTEDMLDFTYFLNYIPVDEMTYLQYSILFIFAGLIIGMGLVLFVIHPVVGLNDRILIISILTLLSVISPFLGGVLTWIIALYGFINYVYNRGLGRRIWTWCRRRNFRRQGKRKVFGVRIFGKFVPVRVLYQVESKLGANEKPIFHVCTNIDDGHLESRLYYRLTLIEPTYLQFILRKVKESMEVFNKQGLVVTCPEKPVVLKPKWKKLCSWFKRFCYDDEIEGEELESFSVKDFEKQGSKDFVQASYIAITALEASTKQLGEYNIKFLLSGLNLIRCLLNSDGNVDAFISLHHFYREHEEEINCFDLQDIFSTSGDFHKQSIGLDIIKKLIEAVTIMVTCRMLNISKEFADMKSVAIFLRENILSTAKNIVDMVFAAIKVISSGDMEDFISKVSTYSTDKESVLLTAFATEYEGLKNSYFKREKLTQHLMALYLLLRNVEELSQKCKTFEKEITFRKCEALRIKVSSEIYEYESSAEGCGSRKEPLLFGCLDRAGTGKTLIGSAVQNGIARALQVSSGEMKHLSYVWSPGQQFQEGAKNHTALIIMDEAFSVASEYDSNIGATCYALLQLGSSRPMQYPHAFETKGKHNSKNLLSVVMNSNGDWETFKKIYSQQGENFFRRFVFVETIPRGKANLNGLFRPDLIPEDERNIEGLRQSMNVRAFTVSPKDYTIQRTLYSGDILGFTDFVEKQMNERISGKYKEVGDFLDLISTYKVTQPEIFKKQSLTTIVEYGSFLYFLWLFFSNLFWIIIPWKVKFILYLRTWYATYLACYIAYHIDWVAIRISFSRNFEQIRALSRLKADLYKDKALLSWNKVRDRCKEILSIHSVKLILLGIGIGVGCVAYKFKKSFDSESVSFEQQGFSMPVERFDASEFDISIKEFMDRKVPIIELPEGTASMQALYSYGNSMGVREIDKVRSNYVLIRSNQKGVIQQMHGSRIKQSILSVGHLYDKSDGDAKVCAKSCLVSNQIQSLELKMDDVFCDESLEISLTPNLLPSGVRDLSSVMKWCGPPLKVGDKVRLIHTSESKDLEGVVENLQYNVTYDDGGPTYQRTVIRWKDGQTCDGDCGLWVVRDVGNNKFQFVGIIIAINLKDTSLSAISRITIEDILSKERSLNRLEDDMWNPQSSLCLEECVPNIVKDGKLRGLFKYPLVYKDFHVRILGTSINQTAPSGSSLIASPFFDIAQNQLDKWCNGIKYERAVQTNVIRYDDILKANRIVSPYEVGMMRKNQEETFIRYNVLVDFLKDMREEIISKCEKYNNRTLTVDEALLRQEGLAPVDPRRAASLPDSGTKGSFMYEFIGKDELKRVADLRLRHDVSRMGCMLARGDILFGYSKTSLKDEVLEFKKIESVKTRLFESVHFSQYMLNRMIFGGLIPVLLGAIRKIGVCIGINASSKDWNLVHYRTDPDIHGGVLTDADISRMDKNMLYSIHVGVYSCLLSVCKRLMNEGDLKIAKNIMSGLFWQELQTVRLVDGTFVLSYAGNCSGSFWTTIINSLVLQTYIYMCYNKKFPNLTGKEYFKEIVPHMCVYGDDLRLLITVKYPITFEILQNLMLSVGQEMTSGGVQKSILQVETGGGKTFLKRGFRKCGDRVFCPLEVTSLLKSLLYYKPSGNREQDWIRHASMLTTLWDESFFHEEEIKNKLRDICRVCFRMIPQEFMMKLHSDEELLARWDNGLFKVWEL